METQTHTTRAEILEGRPTRQVDDMREDEKEFLKNLYVFMKKRDTPIERIPNLGFKQIDLFVMFTTVQDLGGYHQVTAQQLWKQVYNMLGGNPRSTSAATCTRRHYEKLLLPYECHVKGISMSMLPQPKHFHFTSYSKQADDGPRPAKRTRVMTLPLSQSSHTNQPDRHGSSFHLPSMPFPSFYHPSHTILPPSIPSAAATAAAAAAAPPQFPFTPYPLNTAETVKEPLEHLRYLAERYKNSSGLNEPLNLSVKAPKREASGNPVSSFAPPSSSKNPKFLNKPSPLYTPRGPQVVSRGERCEAQDAEVSCGDAPNPNTSPDKAKESYVIEVKAITASRSPTSTQNHPTSPKDLVVHQREEREASPEDKDLNLSRFLPSIPRDNSGEMEIEIPLSVFQNWLRQCKSSGNKPPLPVLKDLVAPSDEDVVLPTDLTCHMNPQQLNSVAEDLRVRPTTSAQPAGNHNYHNMSQNPFTGYKPLPLGGVLKNTAGQDVFPFELRDAGRSYGCWERDAPGAQAPPVQTRQDSTPVAVPSSKPYGEDPLQVGRRPEMTSSSAFLMMNSGSAPLLHLTTEEVMKLKRIISSSS